MGIIIFNGKSTTDYGLISEIIPGYEVPERDYEIIHIPGRNGDLVIDKGSYQNVDRVYHIACVNPDTDFPEMANAISRWVHTASGYARLEDSYEPDYYRLAMYHQSANIDNVLQKAARMEVVFNCKPQRFLKTGDEGITITAGQTKNIVNPTDFISYPLIKVKSAGGASFKINGSSIVALNGPLWIDSELQDCYYGTINKNSYVTMANGFPIFEPGTIAIQCLSGEIEVVPKWWTL